MRGFVDVLLVWSLLLVGVTGRVVKPDSDAFYTIDGTNIAVGLIFILNYSITHSFIYSQTSLTGRDHRCVIEYVKGLEFGGKLNCWGADLHGETIPPKDYFVQIVNGWSWSCGIKIDQTISCWGKILIFSPEDTAGHSSTFLIPYLFTHLLTNSTGLFNQITAADNYACGIMIAVRQ